MRAPDDLRAANADASRALQEWLERALRGLPIIDSPGLDVIPYSSTIPGIARHLMMFARCDPDAAATAAARKKARAAAEELGKLPFIATAAVGGVACAVLQAKLMEFADGGRPGRPPKASAERVAEYLHQEFSRLTGKRPGRSVHDSKETGVFTGLLREVFDALGVKASSDAVAKKIIGRYGAK